MFSVLKTQWGGNRGERENRRVRSCGVAYTKRNAQFSANLVESVRVGFTTGFTNKDIFTIKVSARQTRLPRMPLDCNLLICMCKVEQLLTLLPVPFFGLFF